MIATTLPLLRLMCPDSVAAVEPGSKAEPLLYPILCRREVLGAAGYFVRANMLSDTLADCEPRPRISTLREGTFIDTLQAELASRRYQPGTVSRIMKNRLHRPSRLLSVKDRVVHTALLLVLDVALTAVCAEDDAEQARTLDALRRTVRQGSYGFHNFDIEGRGGGSACGSYQTLLRLVAAYVCDEDVRRLLKLFLKAPVVNVWTGEWRAAG